MKNHTIMIASIVLMSGGCPNEDSGGDVTPRPEVPSLAGEWAITYDDLLDVEIAIGGAVSNVQIGPNGGTVEVQHSGRSFMFDIDCSQPGLVMP